MALNFPIEAFLQAAMQKGQNQRQSLANLGPSIGNMGTGLSSAVKAIEQARAKQQLLAALQQPQQTPMQGPLQASGPAIQGPQGYMPPGGVGNMVPAGQSPMPERPMMQNPQADIMGPLMQLYPEMLGKSLEAQINPLTQSEIFKNLQTGKGTDSSFSPEALSAAEQGNYGQVNALSGGKGISSKLLPFMSQALARKGVQGRFNESDSDRDLTRQLRIDKGIADIGLKIDSHPVIKKLRDQEISLGQVSELLDLVKSGNTVASAAMGIKMAKAMGEVGVMTDQDIKRYVQSGKLTQSAGDKLSKWAKGVPSEATQAEITEMVNMMKGSFDQKIQPFLDRQVNLVSRNYGLTPEDAAFKLDVPYTGMTGKKVASQVNTLGAPKVGSKFNGAKVLAVERVD